MSKYYKGWDKCYKGRDKYYEEGTSIMKEVTSTMREVTRTMKEVTRTMVKRIKRFYWGVTTKQLDGVGIIEIILILVIIIGLVLIFKDQIGQIIEDAFASIKGDTPEITEKIVID